MLKKGPTLLKLKFKKIQVRGLLCFMKRSEVGTGQQKSSSLYFSASHSADLPDRNLGVKNPKYFNPLIGDAINNEITTLNYIVVNLAFGG